MQLLINIDVPDLPAAETLYTEVLGLTAGRRFGDRGIELLGAQAPIYLLQNPAGTVAAAGARRDYGRHWTPVHLDVVVDQLEPALERALRAGMVQESDLREANWGRLVRLADPWGHGWCLVQFVSRGYDEITTN
ncbi:MAG TPA: VOC family protein [Pseudoxanthomonas sp.]|nr:VOC family protein [Pseudoxanthomonas sp.]